MIQPRERTRDLGPFRSDVKCCDYQPYLPNFRLGQIAQEYASDELANGDHRGRLVSHLKQSYLTPWGAWPKSNSSWINQRNIIFRSHKRIHEAPLEQSKLTVCSAGKGPPCHFVQDLGDGSGASCSVWNARPAVCREYSCVETPRLGTFDEQDRNLDSALTEEWTLATQCALSQGFTFDDQRFQFQNPGEAVEFYRKTWEWLRLQPEQLLE